MSVPAGRPWIRYPLAAALAAALGAPPAAAAAAPAARTLTVAAASSLLEAFTDLGRAFGAGGTRVEFNFAGSQVLRSQIEQGAAPDVVAMPDTLHMQALLAQGLVLPPRRFAGTRLVIVTPARDTRVASVRDLARPGMRLVLADPAVPAGHYAVRMLDRLAADASLGPELRRAIEANVRSREINVRAVLAKVVLGEADAGLVYATDLVAGAGRVRGVELPPSVRVTADYFAAVLARSPRAREARAFVEFLDLPAGRAILRRHGFTD